MNGSGSKQDSPTQGQKTENVLLRKEISRSFSTLVKAYLFHLNTL